MMDPTEVDPASPEATLSCQASLPDERTCDCCKVRVINTDLDTLFELCEFVQIQIYAGYGARRFKDGDIWEINLCQDCAFELLSPYARLIASEDDQAELVSPLESVAGTIFDPDFNFEDPSR